MLMNEAGSELHRFSLTIEGQMNQESLSEIAQLVGSLTTFESLSIEKISGSLPGNSEDSLSKKELPSTSPLSKYNAEYVVLADIGEGPKVPIVTRSSFKAMAETLGVSNPIAGRVFYSTAGALGYDRYDATHYKPIGQGIPAHEVEEFARGVTKEGSYYYYRGQHVLQFGDVLHQSLIKFVNKMQAPNNE